MKTRTNLHAGASQSGTSDPLQACKKEKEYWMDQTEYMENLLANCSYSSPPPSTYPPQTYYPTYPTTTTGGGYVGGVYYPDRSGSCG